VELCASSAAAFFAVLVFSSCSTGENFFFVLARYTEATPRRVLISLAGAAVRKAGDRRVDIVLDIEGRLGAAARTVSVLHRWYRASPWYRAEPRKSARV